VAEWSKALAC